MWVHGGFMVGSWWVHGGFVVGSWWVHREERAGKDAQGQVSTGAGGWALIRVQVVKGAGDFVEFSGVSQRDHSKWAARGGS